MKGSEMSEVKFLRRGEASKYLGNTYALQISQSYLAKLAVVGGGPKFYKAGRWPIYSKDELDKWAIERLGDPIEITVGHSK